MLFERQQYQEDCVDNIMSLIESIQDLAEPETFNPADFISKLRELQKEKNILITNTKKEMRLDVLMETGTGKTFTYLKAMYEMHKQFKQNKFVIFVPRLAIRAGILQNIKLTADYFFREYDVRLKEYTYVSKNQLNQVENFIRDDRELSVLILTSASITGSSNNQRILTRPNEILAGSTSPIESIQKLHPVIFIDEPHLLKGEKFMEVYNKYFSSSLLLRFGATFPEEAEHELSNVIYSLDSLTAFRENLVKQISVSTLQDGETDIKFYNYNAKNKTIKIIYFEHNVECHREVGFGTNLSSITGNPKHNFYVMRVKQNEVVLSNQTTRKISSLDYKLTEDSIRIMIRTTIERHFEKEEKLFKKKIKTLSLFFIPPLSKFRSEDSVIRKIFEEEYKIQRNKKLKEKISRDYRQYLELDYDGGHRFYDGYFSGEKGNKDEKESYGVNLILNDKEKLLSTDEPLRFIFSIWALQEGWDNPNIFNICKLSSTDRETNRRQQVGRGLRLAVNNEGKRQTFKELTTENEFYDINTLDVIVSEHEYGFIDALQREIVGDSITSNTLTRDVFVKLGLNESQINRIMILLEDHDIIIPEENQIVLEENQYSLNNSVYIVMQPIAEFLEENRSKLKEWNIPEDKCANIIDSFKRATHYDIQNRNKPKEQVGIRGEKFEELKELWDTITTKAKINYGPINEDTLVQEIESAFDNEKVDPINIKIIKQVYDHEKNEIVNSGEFILGDVDFFKVSNYEDFISKFADRENLPLRFCIKVFNSLDRDKIKNNPKKAALLISTIIKDTLHRSIIQRIDYKFDGGIEIGMDDNPIRSIFYEEDGTVKKEIPAIDLGKHIDENNKPAEKYLYEQIVYDSNIEKDVAKKDPPQVEDERELYGEKYEIVVFAKLPKINIPTPYKSYSPDFAYFIKNKSGQKIFLVVETKGYKKKRDIPKDEQVKIDYARKFFAKLNDHTEGIEIYYTERIDDQELLDLLNRVREG